MALTWVRDEQPRWDPDKQRVVGAAPVGVFPLDYADGDGLTGEWWAVSTDDGTVVGYGWLDSMWGDAEILLAVDPAAQHRGVGSFILEQLEQEAASRGLNYVYNVVRPTHPERERVHDWLAIRGYRGDDRDAALRKHVQTAQSTSLRPEPATAAAAPAETADQLADALATGHEESGGYVDVEDHRY